MSIVICSPEEDQYGNSKENIFLAFDIEKKYLGNAYVFPSINYHQTYETPYIIFVDVNVEDCIDQVLKIEVRQKLFDKVLLRAKELRMLKPDLKSRIYSGFEYDKDKLDFFIKNGFDEDYSIIMEADISKKIKYIIPNNIFVIDRKMESEEEIKEYKKIYDEIFVTPLDIDSFAKQREHMYYKNLEFAIDGIVKGGCTVFEKDGYGYIETIYVSSDARGTGLSKIIINYIFEYFLSIGLEKTKLEVWETNKRAVNLYKSFGYNEIKKNLMFPGINV